MTRPRPARHRDLAVLPALLAASVVLGACAEPFRPRGEEASRAREAATDRVARRLADVAGSMPVLSGARFDQCASGQDNWKRRDEHAHECTVAAAGLVPLADRRADVSQALVALHARLTSLGCAAQGDDDLEWVERTYWRDRAEAESASTVGLPAARYACGEVEVEVQPLAPEASPGYRRSALAPDVLLSASVPDQVLVDEPFGPDALGLVEDRRDGIVAVVTTSQVYYSTGF